MSVPKAKRKTKQTKIKSPFEIVRDTNKLNLSVVVRILYTVFGFRKKRLETFLEAYISLIQEISDKRSTVRSLSKDTEDLTGIDTMALLDEVFENRK